MKMIKYCFIIMILFIATVAEADSLCFDDAGMEYSINPQILRAIAQVESRFNPRAINRNSNGTYDFGVMQINSNWSQTFGEEWWSTLGDPCTNIKAGARILALCMKKYGYNWEAIGCYNSQTPGKRNKYALAVFKQLQRNERDDRQNASKSIKDALEDKPPGHVENSANAGQSRDGENHPVSQAQTLPDDLLEASIPDTEE